MTDILTRLAALATKDERGMLRCPVCGQRAYIGEEKKWHCQLHGDPHQSLSVYCRNPSCAFKPKVVAGDVFNGGRDEAKRQVIELWNSRPREEALIALVQDAAGEIERLEAEHDDLIEQRRIAAKMISRYLDPQEPGHG